MPVSFQCVAGDRPRAQLHFFGHSSASTFYLQEIVDRITDLLLAVRPVRVIEHGVIFLRLRERLLGDADLLFRQALLCFLRGFVIARSNWTTGVEAVSDVKADQAVGLAAVTIVSLIHSRKIIIYILYNEAK